MIEADEYTYEYIETDIETDIDDMKRKLGTDIDDMKRKLEDDIGDAQFFLSCELFTRITEAPDKSKWRNFLLAIGAKCTEITGQGLSSRYKWPSPPSAYFMYDPEIKAMYFDHRTRMRAYFEACKMLGSYKGMESAKSVVNALFKLCLLYTSPSPRDQRGSRMPSSA